MPNNAEIDDLSGSVYRPQGEWEKALASFRRARDHDPRRAHFEGLPETLRTMRRWTEASQAYQQGLQLEPNIADGWIGFAASEFGQTGDVAQARRTLEQMPETMRSKPPAMNARWRYAMLARDFAAAKETIPKENEFPTVEVESFYQGCTAYAQGDLATAHDFPEAARPSHALLGKLYCLLDRKAEAKSETRRAIELSPSSRDAVKGPTYEANLAFIDAHSEDSDEAIAILTHLLSVPSERITLVDLQKSWEWDPLHSDPRFEKLIAAPSEK